MGFSEPLFPASFHSGFLKHGAQGEGGGCEGPVAIWHHGCDCDIHWIEGVRLQESACQPRSSGSEGSQVDREVHCSWPGDAEAENEASDESGQEEMFGQVMVVKAKPAKKVVKV